MAGKKQEEEEYYDPDSITEALRVALSKPQVLESILVGAKAWATNRPEEIKLRFRVLHLNLFLALFLFAAIGLFGYLNVISGEVTAGLLGSLIGYWYGQSKK